MRICAYLNFRGNAMEAIKFYSGIFRTEPEIMTYAEMPPNPDFPVTQEMKPKVLHAELFIDKEQSIMFSDDLRPEQSVMGNILSLALLFEHKADQVRIFKDLSKGGTITMPLAETFWSASFGAITDRFGVNWHLNLCREPEPTLAKPRRLPTRPTATITDPV